MLTTLMKSSSILTTWVMSHESCAAYLTDWSMFIFWTLLVWVIDANLISIIWLIVKQPYDWNKLSWIHLFYRKINNFNYRCEYMHINNLSYRINFITKSYRRLFYWFLMHAKSYAFYRFSCLALKITIVSCMRIG